jgi:hypothetical protein
VLPKNKQENGKIFFQNSEKFRPLSRRDAMGVFERSMTELPQPFTFVLPAECTPPHNFRFTFT